MDKDYLAEYIGEMLDKTARLNELMGVYGGLLGILRAVERGDRSRDEVSGYLWTCYEQLKVHDPEQAHLYREAWLVLKGTGR